MKRLFVLYTIAMSAFTGAAAQTVAAQTVSESRVDNTNHVVMDLVINLRDVNPTSNEAVVIIPQISNGRHTVDLGAVGVYGRKRYYYLQREGYGMLSWQPNERVIRMSEKPDTVHIPVNVKFENWMNNSPIFLERTDYGCCNCEVKVAQSPVGTFFDRAHYLPTLIYRQPAAQAVKCANVEGSAKVLFELNDTHLNTTFANNKMELRKIYAVIDSVKRDPDITLTGIRLKGYASPDGSYADNTVLARERTEAIRNYILNLYRLDQNFITCESEPEDWEGAREFVSTTTMPGHEEVLKIIDTVEDPDERDDRIRREYPYVYKLMSELCYPTLRHTDYRVSYTIRKFTNVNELARVFEENPGKLSLNELYLLANRFEPGSADYNRVFLTAVLLYPNDSVANLNAANVALSQFDAPAATQFLHKAGDSAEAEYARGVLNVVRKNYASARTFFTKARNGGIKEAEVVLKTIESF